MRTRERPPYEAPLVPRGRLLGHEVLLVLGVSLGASAVYALLNIVGSLTSGRSLASQQANLVISQAPGRPWLDLAYQLVGIAVALVPVLLVGYLLARSGESFSVIGFDLSQRGRDAVRGVVLAALVGGTGLGLYLAAYAAGVNLRVVPESLPAVWWRIPVLLLAALQNGLLEETIVAGYLLHRLDQLGWARGPALLASATLRGTYHLYQGFGGFVGNLVMGLLFGALFQRWRRCTPLVVAHTLIDAVAFVGYVLLHGHVSWLP
jgi:membrane protease YdiL (CAAX protease family)